MSLVIPYPSTVLHDCLKAANRTQLKQLLGHIVPLLPEPAVQSALQLARELHAYREIRRSPWQRLPVALLGCIFEFLSVHDKLVSVECVCWEWHENSKHDGCGWRRVTFVLNSGSRDCLTMLLRSGRMDQHTRHLRLISLTDGYKDLAAWSARPVLRELWLKPLDVSRQLASFEQSLETLVIMGDLADGHTTGALPSLPRLRTLVVSCEPPYGCWEPPMFINKVLHTAPPHLTQLCVSQRSFHGDHILSLARFTRLAWLKLGFDETNCLNYERKAGKFTSPSMNRSVAGNLAVGEIVDAKDRKGAWYLSEVAHIQNGRLLIHFINWSNHWDEWINLSDVSDVARLAPPGSHTDGPYRLRAKFDDPILFARRMKTIEECFVPMSANAWSRASDYYAEPWTRSDTILFLSLPCCVGRSLQYLSCTMREPTADILQQLSFVPHLDLCIEHTDDVVVSHTLSSMHNVKWLRLVQGSVSDKALLALGRMPQLQVLHLVNLVQVTDDGLLHLQALRLRLLRIGCPGVRGATLRLLHNVSHLVVHQNGMSVAAFQDLAQHPRLEKLTVIARSALEDMDQQCGFTWDSTRSLFAKTHVRFEVVV